MSPGKRRRVTFAEEPDIVTYEQVADHEVVAQQREGGSHTTSLNFHLQDPPATVVEVKEEVSDWAMRQHELDNMQGIEDTSILEDLAEAEEGYDKPDQAFNEAGIAFEPFHLKKEREEGYFDADGNYIQYKLDEVKDAWLDSLAEAGTSSSSELAAPQTSKQSTAPVNQQLTELDADELLTYKRRLVDLLQPHETVLTALRRLGGRQEGGQAGADVMPWKRSRKSAGGDRTTAPQPMSRESGSAASPSTRTGRTVPVENRVSVRVLEASKLSVAARRCDPSDCGCRDAFERLTEYSSLLLQHGDYNIHSTKREQIAAETDAGEAAQLQAVMGVLTTACTTTASQESSQTNAIKPMSNALQLTSAAAEPVQITAIRATPSIVERAMPSTSGLEISDGMDVDAPSVAELAGSGAAEAAAEAAAAEQAVPADPDEDIFEALKAAPVQAAAATQRQLPFQEAQAPVAKSDSSDHDQGGAAACAIPESSAFGGSVSDTQDTGSGFLYDAASGTWYNADLGYYYDATQGLYGDATSGHWYSFKDGIYQLVC
ncbi:TPA: hypothetical protein ACH3X2_003471 [Trebouxia sp. C0005]